MWNLSDCVLAQLNVRGFWHRVGLWVEHGTPGVSNIEDVLVINNNNATLKTIIWCWCNSLNFKNFCSKRHFLHSFIKRTVFCPLSMIFRYATYAVVDEHVSPPSAQPVSVLQWEGLTFLFKDALLSYSSSRRHWMRGSGSCGVQTVNSHQITHIFYKVYSYTAYFKKAPTFADIYKILMFFWPCISV